MPLLSLQKVELAFGGPPLLDGVDLRLEAGDRLCLLGRNGSGKTSLLRLVTGELQPDAGAVHRQQNLRVGSVPQDVPEELRGSVAEIVAGGFGEATALLARHHRVSQALAHPETLEAGEADRLLAELERLQHELEQGGGWELQRKVEQVTEHLRLPLDADFATLSGGTRRRALLARALVSGPEILVLDEPTNHLDIETITWLETFLLESVRTVLFVTHDRFFARRLANRVAELDRGHLFDFDCGYDEFVGRREELLENEVKRRAAFDKKLAQEEAWIRQGIQARRTRNEGRVRALKKMREEHRLRRQRLGKARMEIQQAGRSGALVAEAKAASFGYGGAPVIRELSTTVMRGDRLGIVGPNGSGKTTLLRLLLGEVEPEAGEVRAGTRRELLYFDQLREQLDPEQTVLHNVGEGHETLIIGGRPRAALAYLQDFLFTPDRARSPVRILSGGERSRLMLAKLFARPSNLLVLDEPTNDLDLETLGLLEDLLVEYEGTLLLVSHDRAFLDNVVTGILAVGEDGRVVEYAGGYSDYERQAAGAAAGEEEAPPPPPRKKERPPRDRPAGPRKLTNKEREALAALPETIARLEAEQEALHASMADPRFYERAVTEASRIRDRLAALEEELEEAYERWQALETLAEGGAADA
ncbi:MAG: ATP-binding cassette domain-containing protein [Deltaproteobacteria bacterium]|nr:ATP-binding cassette domain-containing protein [Deltaproteobacteria bacterium]